MSLFFMFVRGETQPEDIAPDQWSDFAGGRSEAVYGREDALALAAAYGYEADKVHLVEITDEEMTLRSNPIDLTRCLTEYNTGNDYPCLFTDEKTQQQMISFFDKPIDYARNKRKVMKVGRYLERLKKKGLLDGEEWQIYDIQMSLGVAVEGITLQFAKTREEIRNVYVKGPRSCMSGEGKILAKGTPRAIHPVELYADAGLQVAYIEMNGKIISRAVCNPEQKSYIRIYGTDRLMLKMLEQAGYGYSPLVFVGVRFPVVPAPSECGQGNFIMPYIDGSLQTLQLSECGKYFEIQKRTGIISGSEAGYSSLRF